MDYIDKIFKTVSIKDSRRIIELYFQELYCFAPLSNKALSQKFTLAGTYRDRHKERKVSGWAYWNNAAEA